MTADGTDPRGAVVARNPLRPTRPLAWIATIAVVAAVGVSGLCSGGWWFGVSVDDLDQELDALRTRGAALTPGDLPPSRLRRPGGGDDRTGDGGIGDDAAGGNDALRAAWDWLRDAGPPESEWPRVNELTLATFTQLSSDEQAALRKFTTAIAPFLALLRQAADGPALRLAHPADDFSPVHDHARLEPLTHALRLIRFARITRWDENAGAAYLDLVRLQADLAAHLVTSPSSIEALQAVGALSDVLVAGREALSRADVRASHVRAAVAPALDCAPDELFRSALRRDRAEWIAVMRRMSGDLPQGASGAPFPTAKTPWRARSMRAGAVAWLRSVEHVLDAPDGDYVESARRVREWLERPNPYWAATFDPGRAAVAMARILPARLCREIAYLAARQRLCALALAAHAQHEELGSWPGSLASVAQGLPDEAVIDPFSGSEFAFFALGSADRRVLISSPGPVDVGTWGQSVAPERSLVDRGLAWELRR